MSYEDVLKASLDEGGVMMHRTSKIGVVLAVALLVAGLAAPAGAKKGGHPGPPSGQGLEVTVEPSGSAMWANSVGDKIPFDITVTNTSGGDLTGVTVTFVKGESAVLELGSPFDLPKNGSWTATHLYTVEDGDFTSLPISEQSQVTVGTVTAAAGDISDSDNAVMTAYPVLPCEPSNASAGFTFGPNEEYSVCSFTAEPDSYWTLRTKLAKKPHGKSSSPSATVRDGVPGNWCNYGDSTVEGETVIDHVFLPEGGVCLHGGAGGDTFPVRNTDTFYLATWAGNTVTATPDES